MVKKGDSFSAYLLAVLFSLPITFATNAFDNVNGMISSILTRVFFDFSTVGQTQLSLWIRILLFVILFSLFYILLPLVPIFGDKSNGGYHAHAKRFGFLISFALAFLSIVLIPPEVLITIASTYGLLATVLFIGGPLVGIIIGLNKGLPTGELNSDGTNNENRTRNYLIHAFAYYFFATILHNFTNAVQTSQSLLSIQDFTNWSSFIEGFALIAFIVYLILALVHLFGKSNASQNNTGGNYQNPVLPQNPNGGNNSSQILTPPVPIINPQRPPNVPLPTIPKNPWPDPVNPKHDPKPPKQPVLPVPKDPDLPPVIPPPQPTRHVDVLVDLSPMFLPIKNQNQSSACTAFAGTAVVEYIFNRARDRVLLEHELSELFLWYIVRKDKNINQGAVLSIDVPNALEAVGVCSENDWVWPPITPAGIPLRFAERPTAAAFVNALNRRTITHRRLPPYDPDMWVDELLRGNPILIGVYIYESFIDASVRPFLYHSVRGKRQGGHALVIVGYTSRFPDPRNPGQTISAFKIRNSWGSSWGENGYAWITRDLFPQILVHFPVVLEGIQKDKGELTLLEIQVIPKENKITVGNAVQFTAWGRYSDNGTRNITQDAIWEVLDPRIASSNPVQKNIFIGNSVGQTIIRARMNTVQGRATIIVVQKEKPKEKSKEEPGEEPKKTTPPGKKPFEYSKKQLGPYEVPKQNPLSQNPLPINRQLSSHVEKGVVKNTQTSNNSEDIQKRWIELERKLLQVLTSLHDIWNLERINLKNTLAQMNVSVQDEIVKKKIEEYTKEFDFNLQVRERECTSEIKNIIQIVFSLSRNLPYHTQQQNGERYAFLERILSEIEDRNASLRREPRQDHAITQRILKDIENAQMETVGVIEKLK